MKRTIERRIADGGQERRFALTLTLADQDAKTIAADEDAIASVMAQAADLVQRVLYPPAFEPGRKPHPRDTALFESVRDGGLFRIRCSAEDVEKIQSVYRYLVGAYDERGRLLPTFWHLPLIDLTTPPIEEGR